MRSKHLFLAPLAENHIRLDFTRAGGQSAFALRFFDIRFRLLGHAALVEHEQYFIQRDAYIRPDMQKHG
ncbi:hypothetical protein SDC9_77866 [bioreactor metagenome]|uniref:Uncharacterized protein n=1 Tax=bioreactor metagenome TaxID=1076179 RepID=A0A644YTW9_9ZZZZ